MRNSKIGCWYFFLKFLARNFKILKWSKFQADPPKPQPQTAQAQVCSSTPKIELPHNAAPNYNEILQKLVNNNNNSQPLNLLLPLNLGVPHTNPSSLNLRFTFLNYSIHTLTTVIIIYSINNAAATTSHSLVTTQGLLGSSFSNSSQYASTDGSNNGSPPVARFLQNAAAPNAVDLLALNVRLSIDWLKIDRFMASWLIDWSADWFTDWLIDW